MRFFNQDKTKEIKQEEVDLKKYKFVNDKLLVAHHEAVESRPKKSHLEVVATYPNGGRTMAEVVDEEEVVGHEAYDEYEDIMRVEPLSEQELLDVELRDLDTWFNEYDNQVKQYSRCQRLGTEYDKDIKTLDEQATINASRISEIRTLLKGEN